MLPLTYAVTYKTPEICQLPEVDLIQDIKYANLNSRDYARRPFNRQLRMNTTWECVTSYQREIAIATNKLSGREWTGSVWGLETPNTRNACFKMQCNALVTRLLFSSSNILLLALQTGGIQVWSTHSEVRNAKNPYCLFLIGEKCEHIIAITSMESVKKNMSHVVTGCRAGTVKVWDIGGADLASTGSFRLSHTHAITGIDTSAHDEAIFSTCSLDKSALIWDHRITRPAIVICAKHNVGFRDIKGSGNSNNAGAYIMYLGDESGFLHTADIRVPNKFLQSAICFDRPIRKIQPQGLNLAILTDTNVTVYNTQCNQVIYQDKPRFIIRDCVWYNTNELLSVGSGSKLSIHSIPI